MTVQPSHLSHPKYRPDIDGLRAVAVLAVVAFHAFPRWIRGGFVGVDIFFVISGYLISTILFENLDRGTFSFAEFYARRIKRIFPALIVVFAACFAFGWFVLLADEFKQLGKHIAGGAGFVSNFMLWSEVDYFDNSAETKPLLHLWSLGIEEQFYVVWPLLLWVSWKKNFNLLFVTALVAIASFGLNARGVEQDAVATFYSPQTRFWELLIGSLLAWIALHKREACANIKNKIDRILASLFPGDARGNDGNCLASVLSFAGLFLLLYGFWGINKKLSFPGAWALIPVSGAALIITAGPQSWANRTILSNKVAVWFGLISFPLYLWHWPLLSFARIVEGEVPSPNMRIAAVVLSVGLAWLTYKFVERPIRLGSYGRAKVAVLALCMAIIGYVGYGAYSHDGLTFRPIFQYEPANAVAFDWPEEKKRVADCLDEISPYTANFCVLSKSFPIKVALIGDSHANALYEFVRDYYAQRGIGVIQLGQGGCPPFLGVERNELNSGNCPKAMDDVVAYLEKNKDITKVFLAGRFAATLTGKKAGGTVRHVCDFSLRSATNPEMTDRKQIFEEGFRAMVVRLLGAKKDVAVILDSPELSFDPRSCLKRSLGNDCRMKKDVIMRRQAAYRKIISKIASEYKLRVIDLVDAFCADRYCEAKSDGKILYRDRHHLGVWSAEYLRGKNFQLD